MSYHAIREKMLLHKNLVTPSGGHHLVPKRVVPPIRRPSNVLNMINQRPKITVKPPLIKSLSRRSLQKGASTGELLPEVVEPEKKDAESKYTFGFHVTLWTKAVIATQTYSCLSTVRFKNLSVMSDSLFALKIFVVFAITSLLGYLAMRKFIWYLLIPHFLTVFVAIPVWIIAFMHGFEDIRKQLTDLNTFALYVELAFNMILLLVQIPIVLVCIMYLKEKVAIDKQLNRSLNGHMILASVK